jgi:hypothetical protein
MQSHVLHRNFYTRAWLIWKQRTDVIFKWAALFSKLEVVLSEVGRVAGQ